MAGAGRVRSHFTGVFEWTGGVGAEVFGVLGEAEAGLFDPVGRESVELVGIGNWRLMRELPTSLLSLRVLERRRLLG
ncbi:hypothetical protein [Nostoc sp. FACHB-280]|uniref:hypothetical protein n=1 Tax=Nostoc sp. FACHB-280 TaxID=2692839 RepID=UPI00168BAF46|nr:hypothetical protein [Nostoc sp. FACHB-280]MBD2498843.1 hypothetical protein [Nostoc sp. FACHB-280]